MENKYTADRIRHRLAELDKTLEWLAGLCDVSIVAVSKWQRTGRMSRENARLVARALDIPLGELLGETITRSGEPGAPRQPLTMAPPVSGPAPIVDEPAPEVQGVELVYLTPTEVRHITALREATVDGRMMLEALIDAVPRRPKPAAASGDRQHAS